MNNGIMVNCLAIGERVTISPIPGWMSKDQFLAFGGGAGGILFSEWMATTMVSAAKLTGTAANLGSIMTKGAISVGGFWAAGRLTGSARMLAWTASLGSGMSILIDLLRPRIEALRARRAALAARRPRVPPRVSIPPAPTAGVPTPAGEVAVVA